MLNGDHVDNHYELDHDDHGDHDDGDQDQDHDGDHDSYDIDTDKNLLNCHQRLPDVFGPPMEGNLVQGFLYQADQCKIFIRQTSSGPCPPSV